MVRITEMGFFGYQLCGGCPFNRGIEEYSAAVVFAQNCVTYHRGGLKGMRISSESLLLYESLSFFFIATDHRIVRLN